MGQKYQSRGRGGLKHSILLRACGASLVFGVIGVLLWLMPEPPSEDNSMTDEEFTKPNFPIGTISYNMPSFLEEVERRRLEKLGDYADKYDDYYQDILMKRYCYASVDCFNFVQTQATLRINRQTLMEGEISSRRSRRDYVFPEKRVAEFKVMDENCFEYAYRQDALKSRAAVNDCFGDLARMSWDKNGRDAQYKIEAYDSYQCSRLYKPPPGLSFTTEADFATWEKRYKRWYLDEPFLHVQGYESRIKANAKKHYEYAKRTMYSLDNAFGAVKEIRDHIDYNPDNHYTIQSCTQGKFNSTTRSTMPGSAEFYSFLFDELQSSGTSLTLSKTYDFAAKNVISKSNSFFQTRIAHYNLLDDFGVEKWVLNDAAMLAKDRLNEERRDYEGGAQKNIIYMTSKKTHDLASQLYSKESDEANHMTWTRHNNWNMLGYRSGEDIYLPLDVGRITHTFGIGGEILTAIGRAASKVFMEFYGNENADGLYFNYTVMDLRTTTHEAHVVAGDDYVSMMTSDTSMSGLVVLHASESNPIIFPDMRGETSLWSPGNSRLPFNDRFKVYPKTGDMIIFPSQLPYEIPGKLNKRTLKAVLNTKKKIPELEPSVYLKFTIGNTAKVAVQTTEQGRSVWANAQIAKSANNFKKQGHTLSSCASYKTTSKKIQSSGLFPLTAIILIILQQIAVVYGKAIVSGLAVLNK